ncbi:hypothetical protein DFA_11592 [Cavenderia fasciculata]|uniref:RING-type domain-containing protein n=1 Tax=Cavenderia fasciculata TaxID=261658 RepID=F4QDN4_CACFS|nr:uncharacterized protein DFA_11592 [Cavenderia fasciculata]EGG13831.1 hypothetical protein DFA_11592 [Cavenderia fasciculata]|eukprot:XP_004350539.1 hypothetical protein DFA_11592 [Cavenderia fasciculata]
MDRKMNNIILPTRLLLLLLLLSIINCLWLVGLGEARELGPSKEYEKQVYRDLDQHNNNNKEISIHNSNNPFNDDDSGNNHIYTDICSTALTLDDVTFDLTPLRYSLLSFQHNNSTFYINLCLNYTSPCPNDNVVCQVNSDGSTYSLAYGSTLTYSNNGLSGFTLWYFGQPCVKTQDFNTSVVLLCDESTDYQVINVESEDCNTSIYLKSKYACGVYSDNGSHSTFNLIIFFSTLFGTILMFICVAGCIYSASRFFGRCLRRNVHNTYQPLLGGGVSINYSSGDGSSSPTIYKHEIIDNNNTNDGTTSSTSTTNNNNNNICKICFENKIDTVLLDCGHMANCLICAQKVDRCPICRGPIKKVVKIYQV